MKIKSLLIAMPVVMLSACASTQQMQDLTTANAQLEEQVNYLQFENAKLKENQTRLMRQQVIYRIKHQDAAVPSTLDAVDLSISTR